MDDPTSRLQVTIDGSRLVVTGEIDAHTAPWLGEHLDPLPPGSNDVVLDVAGVEFIDSSGLRLLVDGHQRAESEQRRLVLAAPSVAVLRLLEISGLRDHLAIDTSSG